MHSGLTSLWVLGVLTVQMTAKSRWCVSSIMGLFLSWRQLKIKYCPYLCCKLLHHFPLPEVKSANCAANVQEEKDMFVWFLSFYPTSVQLTKFSAITCYVTALLRCNVITTNTVHSHSNTSYDCSGWRGVGLSALKTHYIILLNIFWVVTMLQSSLLPMDRLPSLSPLHCLLFFIFYKGKLVWSYSLCGTLAFHST